MMESSAGEAIKQLRQAVIAQKTVNLEESPGRQDLAELHDLLREYDSFVSQLVIAVLQGGVHETGYPKLETIDRELERVEDHVDPMVVREVRKYAQYKQRLDNMLGLAKQVVDQRKRQA